MVDQQVLHRTSACVTCVDVPEDLTLPEVVVTRRALPRLYIGELQEPPTQTLNGRMITVHDEIERVVFASELVRIGAFRCHPHHPSFQDTGPIENYCFVFPRTSVKIQHEHEPAFIANPNVVTFYNVGQVYLRNPISPEGDHCDWFGIEREFVRDVVRALDPRVDDYPDRPFRFSRGWSDAHTYLAQRRLFTQLMTNKAVDPLAVEETVVALLERVIRSTYSVGLPEARKQEISRCQRHTVHDIEAILGRRTEERITITAIAQQVGLSTYHVCRLFPRVTGIKLHQYRLGLRLREALTEVLESGRPLTDIALDAGFSSHSHFTDMFRRHFRITPSSIRATVTAHR